MAAASLAAARSQAPAAAALGSARPRPGRVAMRAPELRRRWPQGVRCGAAARLFGDGGCLEGGEAADEGGRFFGWFR